MKIHFMLVPLVALFSLLNSWTFSSIIIIIRLVPKLHMDAPVVLTSLPSSASLFLGVFVPSSHQMLPKAKTTTTMTSGGVQVTIPPIALGNSRCNSAISSKCCSVALVMVWKTLQRPNKAVLDAARSMYSKD